jgi:hypothetical protein
MPDTLKQQVEAVVAALVINEARSDIWVNGDETADYTTSGGVAVPSIRKLIANTFNYQGAYASGGTDYTIGQTFKGATGVDQYKLFRVHTSFTSTTLGADAANYDTIFDFSQVVTDAETAQAAAESARDAALAVFDSFDDRYLGTFATVDEPTVDNDGDPLEDGAIYWDTTINRLKFYDLGNTAWVDPSSDAAASAAAALTSADNAAASAANAASATANKQPGGGAYFDGVSGFLDFPTFNFVSGTALHLKFKPKLDNYNRFLSNTTTASNWLDLFRNGSNELYVRNSAGTLFSGTVDTFDLADRTFDLTISFVGGDLLWYVDGVLFDTVTVGASSVFTFSRFSAQPGSTIYYENTLHNLTFFNLALTATQAAEIAAEGIEPWLARNPEHKWGNLQPVFGSLTNTFGSLPSYSSSDETEWGYNGAPSTSRIETNMFNVRNGQVVKLSLTRTGASHTISVRIRSAGVDISNSVTLVAGANDITLTATSASDSAYIAFIVNSSGVSESVTIDDLSYKLLGALAVLPLDDGGGFNLRDLTGRYPALASATGVEHLVSKDRLKISRAAQDFSSSGLWLRAGNILAADSVIIGAIIDGEYKSLAAINQDTSLRRVYCTNTAGTLTFSRTSGAGAGTTFLTVTPTDDADVDITLITERVNV